MNTTDALPSQGPTLVARSAGNATPSKGVAARIDRIEDMLAGNAGTQVCTEAAGGADTL